MAYECPSQPKMDHFMPEVALFMLMIHISGITGNIHRTRWVHFKPEGAHLRTEKAYPRLKKAYSWSGRAGLPVETREGPLSVMHKSPKLRLREPNSRQIGLFITRKSPFQDQEGPS